MMRRRRNLIRVFTLAKRCFIYKHVLPGPCAKARPVNIFYNGVKFYTQQMIIPKEKTYKEQSMVTRYDKPQLGLRGLQTGEVNREKKN
jgi:hypothetical protein